MTMDRSSSPSSMSAAFVTYQPNLGLLERALHSVSEQMGTLCVVDNGSDNVDSIATLCSRMGATLVPLGSNDGIAAAYNRAFNWAKIHDCKWVLTCDQDSVMPQHMVDRLLEAAVGRDDDDRLGIICPDFINRTTGRREYGPDAPRLINECISSGSLTSVEAWGAVDGFDEAMFIDGVDFDFCRRLRDAGWSILLVPDVCIEHEIGDARTHRFLGHEFNVLNHSAFRKYYISQNIIYMSGKFNGDRPEFVAWLKVLKQLLLVLLYEDGKREKLASIVRGARHGRQLLRERRANQTEGNSTDSAAKTSAHREGL